MPRRNKIVFTGANIKPAPSYTLKRHAGKMEKVSQNIVEGNRLESLSFLDRAELSRLSPNRAIPQEATVAPRNSWAQTLSHRDRVETLERYSVYVL